MLVNDNKVFCYLVVLEFFILEDKDWRFVFFYFLVIDMISIFEFFVCNFGIIGGKYFGRIKVVKLYFIVDNFIYYGFSDFFIGVVIEVFGYWFIIFDIDEYVLKYMESNVV